MYLSQSLCGEKSKNRKVQKMKSTTKVLALLLVLMLSLTMFVGCSKDENNAAKEEKKETVAQEVEKELDPEEAIVGTWTKECDLSDMLDEYMASSEPDYANYFDFSDLNYVVEVTFDDGEFSISGEFDEDTTDNLKDQIVEGVEKFLSVDVNLTTEEINEYLEQNGYGSIEEFAEEYFDSQELLAQFEETILEADGEYSFDDDKIYLDEDESLWIEYEFDGEDEAEFEFDYDDDDAPDDAESFIDLISGTYTKD